MLETLRIQNLAVIDEAEIPFEEGLNILSGETGAGKSIILNAISLILGSRANMDLIRSGCQEAVVEGLFDIRSLDWMKERLDQHGFQASDGQLLVKRVIHRSGRHRIFINGDLATLSILQEVCEGLVDLCGQHEHQSLLKAEKQFDLIDRFGGNEKKAQDVSGKFLEYRALQKEFENLLASEEERAREEDFLRFQIQELEDAQLNPTEDEKLHEEKYFLQSAEQRLKVAQAASQTLSGGHTSEGVLDSLRECLSQLKELRKLDPQSEELFLGLERGFLELEEVDLSLSRYGDRVDLDPDRLDFVQERLSLLASLKRKYGESVQHMLEMLSSLKGKLAQIDAVEDRLEEIQKTIESTEKVLLELGKKLSQARKKVAVLFGESVTAELKDLRMGDAEFLVELSSHKNLENWSIHGLSDEIEFVVKTNAGEAALPIGKIASGGELSRMMLAIRRVIADRGGIGVYLFDEIDAGIGGQTAFEVGKKLKSVAKFNQVICITHVPQVACYADHHLSVQKTKKGQRTLTEVIELDPKARKIELARMLGGAETTKASLKNAAELLEMASAL
jgi:DNA repair protein RecN (Recombination protein N)